MEARSLLRREMIDEPWFVSEALEFPRQHLLRDFGPVFVPCLMVTPHFLRTAMDDEGTGYVVAAAFDHEGIYIS
jgi:hypothetical protein